VHFVEKVEDQKNEASVMVGEGSTSKFKYIITIPIIFSQINYTA